MKNLSLIELYQLKWKLKREKKTTNIEKVVEMIKIKESELLEDTSSTGGPAVSGMGPFVNSQPSSLAGVTTGPNWISSGGTEGDGSVAVPYNPSGANRVFQKIPAEMGSEHGPRTGKKSRRKRMNLKSLKDVFAKRQDFMAGQEKTDRQKKVMNFDDYLKNSFNTIKK